VLHDFKSYICHLEQCYNDVRSSYLVVKCGEFDAGGRDICGPT
jgi:hypothetical protein